MQISRRTFGPPPRDDLAALSDAPLGDGPFGDIPPLDATSTPGRAWHVAGRDIYCVRTPGPSETAQQAWYLHGLDGMSRNWDRLAAALSPYATGYAPDLPGSGRSGPPHGRYDITAEANLVAHMIESRSGAPVHLVGNSRGGVVATFLAARRPDLVRTLTLISPAVPDFRVTRDRGADPLLGLVMLPGMRGPAERRLAGLAPAQRAAGLAALCFGEPDALRPQDLAAAEAEYAYRATLPWAHRDSVLALRSLIRAQLRRGRRSFATAARGVRVPVLVVWGTRDRLVDVRLARPTAQAFRDSRLLILPRTGHVAQMERPLATARAVQALWDAAAPTSPAGAPSPSTPDRVAP